ncbi:hypothetical protein MT418_004953 [Batrachochytrium dendrobatidis]
MAGLLGQIKEYATKYGAAFVVMTQLLGWITYFGIYLALVTAKIDIAGLLASWNMGKDMVALAKTGGIATLAFALNRLLMPVRLSLCVLLMPLVAAPLNKFLDPCVAWLGFGKKTEDTPADTITDEDHTDQVDSEDSDSDTTAPVAPMIWNVDESTPVGANKARKRK